MTGWPHPPAVRSPGAKTGRRRLGGRSPLAARARLVYVQFRKSFRPCEWPEFCMGHKVENRHRREKGEGHAFHSKYVRCAGDLRERGQINRGRATPTYRARSPHQRTGIKVKAALDRGGVRQDGCRGRTK